MYLQLVENVIVLQLLEVYAKDTTIVSRRELSLPDPFDLRHAKAKAVLIQTDIAGSLKVIARAENTYGSWKAILGGNCIRTKRFITRMAYVMTIGYRILNFGRPVTQADNV